MNGAAWLTNRQISLRQTFCTIVQQMRLRGEKVFGAGQWINGHAEMPVTASAGPKRRSNARRESRSHRKDTDSMKSIPSFFFLLMILIAGCGNESMMTAPDVPDTMEETVNTATFRTGDFEPLNGKATMGKATLNTLPNEMLQLMFSEDFSLSDGPGLFVYLSNGETPSTDALNLGSFISPSGAQNYAIPDGISLDNYTHVIVHCVPYNVTFAFAELK